MFAQRRSYVFVMAFLLSAALMAGGCSDDGASKPERDTTPPLLVSVTAVDDTHVSVLFNEGLDESSAEDTGNYLIPRVAVEETLDVLGAVLMPDLKTVSIETSPQLDVEYRLTAGGIKDLAGNAAVTQFKIFNGTTVGDTTAPVVTKTVPDDGERNAGTAEPIVVEFSERMNRSSAESAFWLQYAGQDPYMIVGSDFSWEANDTRMIVVPPFPLVNFACYGAGVETGAMDVSGNHLSSAHSWTFCTGDPGAISGRISYSGPGGTAGVQIRVFTDACLSETIAWVEIDSPGDYVVGPLTPGTYYIGAFMDFNGSSEPDVGEPAGMYDPNEDGVADPIVVSAGQTRTGISFALEYVFQLSTISGSVSKNPGVTDTDTTYVLLFLEDPTQGDGGEPALAAIIPNGTGQYTTIPVPFGCYYVICFMDLNGNRELDFSGDTPAEPIGFYGEMQGSTPVLTPVFLIENKTGINMTLFYMTGPTPPQGFYGTLKGALVGSAALKGAPGGQHARLPFAR
ncbi:MAG: Ig-like domain-containing protein [Candidatus Eisenbacteria bacterium]